MSWSFKLLGKLDFSKPVKHINMLFLTYEQKKLRVKELTTLPMVIVIAGVLLFSRSRHRLIQDQIRKLREEMEELNESERLE
ncbi:hypothetical protein [Sphingobacterium haloxyli]|uniref:Uncharacterized protein n=1 Tax=Sphingobacterium haloxyli TaxID=2100533 RepID=A0A2S9J071_9SPHI|nr:hypothetical protein [Sphingobacterium haloxyli]PRD46148.1 hypothetical protein C5745_17160 [Sphingobacterium haloxyli]